LNWLRRLYDWILSLADSAYGVVALFLVSFAESSFFPIPADPLLIALALGKVKRAFYYAFVCTAASVFGGMFGYFIGQYIWYDPSDPSGFSEIARSIFDNVPWITAEKFEVAQDWYKCYDFYAIFIAAFTPIPYKIFAIAAGVAGINLPTFILASIIGRGLRFYIQSTLIWFFGPTIKKMMDKYFNWFIIILTIIFVLSYFFIGYMSESTVFSCPQGEETITTQEEALVEELKYQK